MVFSSNSVKGVFSSWNPLLIQQVLNPLPLLHKIKTTPGIASAANPLGGVFSSLASLKGFWNLQPGLRLMGATSPNKTLDLRGINFGTNAPYPFVIPDLQRFLKKVQSGKKPFDPQSPEYLRFVGRVFDIPEGKAHQYIEKFKGTAEFLNTQEFRRVSI